MTKGAIWKNIADEIAGEIAAGHYKAGDKLPTEHEMAARFGVNRHTLRHAIASLVEGGILRTRRGAGVYVAAKPTDYALGPRVRFTQNVLASGRSPSRNLTHKTTRAADPSEAEALALPLGAAVHVIEGLSYIDEQPVSVFRSVLPAARFPDILKLIEVETSLSKALAASGLADYTRASTRLTAINASAVMALALQLPEGAAVLRSLAINVDSEGVPVEYGSTWFAGDRVTLTVNPEP